MLRIIHILFLTSLSFVAFSQVEVCNNGLDDDFDGFIDCYDGDCAANVACDGIFLGNDATCQTPPPVFPAFTMTEDFHSDPETTNHLSQMVIGDLDRDGIPEIATMNRYQRKLFVLNGNNGTIKIQRSVAAGQPNAFEPYWGVAIANLDNDACAEIFYVGYHDLAGSSNDGVYLVAYDCNLTFLWRTAQKLPTTGSYGVASFGITDFDGDGLEELYYKDIVYDAKTGTRIIASTAADFSKINGAPVAVNIVNETGETVPDVTAPIVDDKKQELVLGLAIYRVNLSTRTADAGSLTLVTSPYSMKRADYFIRNEYNATSVADFNLDGSLDVLASGSTIANGDNTTVFFWDVKNNVVQTYKEFIGATGDYVKGWKNGTGRLNVADLDGDGKMNVSYVSGKYLYALKEDFTKLWRVTINEETSGYTGCTLFDFNGDGKSEIVYRDERYIYIINGTTGLVLGSPQPCNSRTNFEYPIVADVDADGSTEICVTCTVNQIADADFASFVSLGSSTALQLPGHVRVFKSAAEPWVPARRVWNQHGYFVVNVNDDLTIPKVIQAHHLVFSSGTCTAGPNRPLNKFLNQSPFLNSSGCPTYASSDIAFSVAPTIVPPTCPNLNFTVSFVITNLGDVSLTGDIPITFYTTNPKKAGSVKLNTITATVNKLKKGDVFAIVNATVTGVGADSVYVVLNDAGTTVPTPIVLPNTTFFECDYDNIIGRKVIPLPVPITALMVTPNETCSGTNTGSARAFIPIGGGGENTADYNFYWSIGAVAKPIASADFVGPIYSGLAAGTYTVFARHKTANCNSSVAQVVITTVTSPLPNVTVNALANQSSCVPPNGQLEAVIVGGSAGYTIDWYDVALNPLGISGATANNLAAGSYLVIISKGGCNKSSSPATITGPIIPDALGQVLLNVTDCLNPTSGSVQADALFNGVAQNPANYTFDWYYYNTGTSTQGSILPPANGVGQTRTALAVGSYQAVIKDNATGCLATAPPITVTSNTVIPTAQIVQLAPQTSCNPATPNGILQGNVLIGGVLQNPASFTFQWFKGQNTLPANLVATTSGTNGQVVNNVAGGGIPYTVKVTTTLNCSATIDFTIAEILTTPVVTLTPTNNQICNPALASSTYNGSVAAAVTFAGVPVVDFTNYSFAWHKGALATDPAPSPNSTTNSLTQQDGGQYTLVVTQSGLACASAPVTTTINNTNTLPVLTTGSTSSTNCVPGLVNGVARVLTVDGAAVAGLTNYSYQWHTGIGTGSPITVGTNPTATAAALTNVQGGVGNNYTALVTNTTTGCQTTGTVLVADAKVLPVVSLAAVDNTVCLPVTSFNGSITATVTNAPYLPFVSGAFTYAFTGGMVAGTPVGNQNTVLNGGATPYAVVATHTATGCASSQVSIPVANNQDIPDITTANTASTNCTITPPFANGRARAVNVDAAPATLTGYSFSWAGPAVPLFDVSGNATRNAIELQNVQGGVGYNYTLTVTNTGNGCTNTAIVNVADGKVLPVVSLAAVDNTVCLPVTSFNGSITATVTNAPYLPFVSGAFTYAFTGGMVAGTPVGNQNTVLNGGATAYAVVATHTATGCASSQVSIPVANNQDIPDITTANTASTNCTITPPFANGRARAVNVDAVPATLTGYSFSWAGPAVPLFDVSGNATRNAIELQNVQGGVGYNYTLTVTNTGNGCTNTAIVNVADGKVLPVVSLAAVDNTVCLPVTSFNGSITATVTNAPYLPFVSGAFTYAFTGGMVAGTPVGNQNTVLNGGATPYAVVATHTATGCASSQVSIPVANNQDIPDITTANTASTNCTITPPFANGRARAVNVDAAPATLTGYSFSWAGPAVPLFDVSGNATRNAIELQNVQGGVGYNYTLTVTNTGNGCTNTAIVNVADGKVLPVVSLAAVDNTVCLPVTSFNGSITATVTNAPYLPFVSGAFTYAFTGGMVAGTPVGNQNTVLNGGATPYAVVATHTATGCASSQVSIPVANNQDIPDITTANTASTNCTITPPFANGRARAVNVDAAPATLTGYSFSWAGPAVPLFDVSGNATRNAIELQNVQGGVGYNYTLTVTNTGNGCTNTAIVNVADGKVLPVVSLAAVDNTVCAPATSFNGSITATVTNAPYLPFVPGAFTYLFTGGMVPGTKIVNQNTVLNGGATAYAVVATHTATGCASSQVSMQVVNNQVLPTIGMGQTASKNCALGANDGIASVTSISPVGQNYDYKWFNGNSTAGTAGPVTLNSAATTNNYPNVQGGVNGVGLFQYTVEVTIVQTGCVNTATVGVDNIPVYPVVTLAAPINNTKCTAPKDGRAEVATLSFDAIPVPDGNFNLFNFAWSAGGTTQNDPARANKPTIYTELAAGAFTLSVTNIANNCTSNPVPVAIVDNLYIPVINAVAVDQTSCDVAAPTGSLTASINENVPGGPFGGTNVTTTGALGYTFSWVDNVDASHTSASNVFSTLKGNQNYTISVVRNPTGCTNSQTFFVDEVITTPTATLAVVDFSQCSLSNGRLTATPSPGVVAGYDFFWYDGSNAADADAVIAVGNSGLSGVVSINVYDQLDPGKYTVVIQDKVTKCKSSQVISEVDNISASIYPVGANIALPTSCILANGALEGGVKVFNTTFTGAAATNRLTTLAAHTLAVGDKIIIARSGTAKLPDPLIDAQTYFVESVPTATTFTLSATFGGAIVDLTTDGNGFISSTFSSTAATDILTTKFAHGLAVNDKIILTRNGLNPLPVPLKESEIYFVESVPSATSVTLAATSGGLIIDLTIDGEGFIDEYSSTGAYTFNWYEGAPSGTNPLLPINYFTNPPDFAALTPNPANPSASFGGLETGLFSLEVTDPASGCRAYIAHTLPFVGSQAVVRISKSNTTVCNPPLADNGSITIQIEHPSAGAVATDTYNVTLLQGVAVLANNPLADDLVNYNLSNSLSPGTFIVQVQQNYGSNCIITQDVTIGKDAFDPLITLTGPITANTACDPLVFNGRIDLNVDKDATDLTVGTTYGVVMTPVVGASGFPLVAQPAGNYSATNLGPGNYSFTATASTGCSSTKIYTVLDNPVLSTFVAANVTIVDAQYCTPALEQTASATVVQINMIGGGADIMNDFQFNWYNSGSVFTTTAATNKINLAAHTFVNNDKVMLTISGVFPVGLSPNKEYYVSNIGVNDFELSLTPGGAIIDITVDGGGKVSKNLFSLQGDDTATEGGEVFSNAPTSTPSAPVTIGTYYLVATKNAETIGGSTGGIGCTSAPFTVTIGDDTVKPTIALTPTGDNSCDPLFFEGSIEVDVATPSGPGVVPPATYGYAWTPNGAPGSGLPVNNSGNTGLSNVFTGINDGAYSLTATSETTGCPNTLSTTLTIITPPVFTLSATAVDQTFCSAPFNGLINNVQVFINGAGGIEDDFDYVWFRTNLATKVLDGENAAITVEDQLTTATYPAIGIDRYFVKSIRKAPFDAIAEATIAAFAAASGGYTFNSGDYVRLTNGDVYKFTGAVKTNAGDYTLSGSIPGAGCESSAITKDILDQRVFPTLNITSISNTSCDLIYDGRITAVANTTGFGLGTLYGFAWTVPGAPAGSSIVAQPAIAAIASGNSTFTTAMATDRIGRGTYSVTVTNQSNSCTSTGSVAIVDTTIPMSITSVTPAHVNVCLPMAVNGSGTIAGILETPGPGNTGNYTYTWATDPLMASTFGVVDDPLLIRGSLAVGTYYATAKRNVVSPPVTAGVNGSGCVTSPATFTVLDQRVFPTLNITSISNTSCDLIYDGRITAVANTTGFGLGTLYGFAWTVPGAPAGSSIVAQPAIAAIASGNSTFTTAMATDRIGRGTYSVTVTNQSNSCTSTGSVAIVDTTIPMSITSVTPAHVNVCLPMAVNGSGTIAGILETPGPGNTGNYTYTWATDPLMASTFGVVDDPLLIRGSLAVGTYYATAKRNVVSPPVTAGVNGSGCVTSPATFTVLDQRVFPTLNITSISNTSCDLIYDGRITAVANTTGFGLGTLYGFAWTVPGAPAGSSIVAQPAIAAIASGNSTFTTAMATDRIGRGTYSVTVTNQSNSCTSTGSVAIVDTTIPMSITSVTPAHVNVCLPMAVNGSGTIAGILETPGPGNTGNYTYTWATDPLMASTFGVVDDPLLIRGSLAVGTYYATAKRNVVSPPVTAGVNGSGCVTSPATFTVLDQRVFPTLNITSISNTSCDLIYDGRITAVANTTGFGLGTLYGFAWTVPGAPAGSSIVAQPAIAAIASGNSTFTTAMATDRIGRGTYSVTVTNQSNSCTSTGSVAIVDTTIPMSITSVTPAHVNVCLPMAVNGSGTIAGILETPGPGNTGNYTYTWATDPLMASTFGVVDDPLLIRGSLAVGTYYATAKRNVVSPPVTAGVNGSGCVTSPATFTVLDQRVFPTLAFTTLPSTSCDTNFDGRISVTAATTGFPATTNYNFDWTGNPAGTTITDAIAMSPYNYQAGDVVGPGAYLISVTNQTNSCLSTGTVSVISNPQPIEILTASVIDQAICYADGSITVNTLSLGVPANYTFAWFRNVSTGTALVDGANAAITTSLLDENNYPTMGGDVYFVTATRNASVLPGSGCTTPPFLVEVKDTHVDPTILFTSTSNSSCNNLLPNGTVLANAAEQNGLNTDTYSFNWTLNGGALPGATTITNTTNSSQLGNSSEGSYVLTVMNTSNTGCSVASNLDLILDQTRSTPNIVDVDWIDPLDCNPNVVATVTKITLGSTTNSLLFPPNVTPNNEISGPSLLNFNYEWYQGSYNAGNQLPIGGPFTVTPVISSLVSGNYFVVVHDPTTDCKSGPKEVVVKGDNIIYPVLEVTQTMKQISCIAITGTASLAATADGQTSTNVNYDFTWFNNLNNTLPTFATTSTVSNLLQGEYSVTVLDKTTACMSSSAYTIKDDSKEFTPAVSVGGQPRTLCVGTDGSVLARVTNLDPTYPFPYDATTFTASLFFGTPANINGTPDIAVMPFVSGFFTSVLQGGLNEGSYTVRITDNNSGCVGVATHVIEDARKYPLLAISEIAPITNCDPARPNGVARVLANGTFSEFQFDWYEGVAVAGVPIYRGAEYGELKADPQKYIVRATDLVSGCTKDIPTSFKDGTVAIPAPTIEKLSDVTSCVISNGALSAYVGEDKNTKDYILSWYDGTVENPPADLIGEIYTDLAAGKYSVTATSKITGCKSPLKTEDVIPAQLLPDFQFIVQNTTCDKSDGFATLIMTSNTPVERIEWSNATGPFLTGPNFSDATYGIYSVTATTFLGCERTKEVEIKPDIRPYNGISRNNDGQNEIFMIDCIQEFPNNVVKIFNRAGTLVYEAQGYDNSTTFFDGKSNKGISPMGVNLPDGTYYYIVDKREGSKPLAGYLEIVN